MVASISLLYLVGFSCPFRAIFVRFSCAPCSPRIVRQVPHRAAKFFASCVSLSLWDRFGFVPRVGRSGVTTQPWQTCVEILGGEFGA
jgi:hypothetical protein